MPEAGEHHLEDLRNDARYSRERYDLYRAKTYGPRPTTLARLRELERIAQGAEDRLRHAEAQTRKSSTPSSGAEDSS